MRWTSVACALACALLMTCAPAAAQHADGSYSPGGHLAPEIAPVTVPATSVAVENTPAVGTTILGPFVPQLGRDVRLVIRGTGWAGTIAVGTSKASEACSTFNPLTVGGQTWASYTANANEVVDTPTLDGIVYCVREVITTVGATVTVRQ